jgi:Fe-S cluster assembly protein SufD
LSLASALRSGDVAELPGKRDEDWRWTDLRGLLRVLPPASPQTDVALPTGPWEDLACDEVAIINGHARGDVTLLQVPAGQRRTVRLRFVAASAETSHAARVEVRLGQGAQLTLLESYEGLASGYVADAALDIVLEHDAALERLVIAADGEGAVSVSTTEVSLAATARFRQTALTTGARRQRLETRVVHPGGGAEVRLDGGYLLAGQHHADLTSVVEHRGVDGTTSQLTKGVVRDQSRGVFQGRILVAEGADRTDARMGHHALILSDRAEVDAKPELLIFADDVQCAHGNTVGALDDDMLFYMQQRGMPRDMARSLLIEAFVGEVVERIDHEEAREIARAWVAERMAG